MSKRERPRALDSLHQQRIDLAWKHKTLKPKQLAVQMRCSENTASRYINIVKEGIRTPVAINDDLLQCLNDRFKAGEKLGKLAAAHGLTDNQLRNRLQRLEATGPKPKGRHQQIHQERIDLAWKHKHLDQYGLGKILGIKPVTARRYVLIVQAGVKQPVELTTEDLDRIEADVQNGASLIGIAPKLGLTDGQVRSMIITKNATERKSDRITSWRDCERTPQQKYAARPFAEWGKIA